MFQQDRPHRRRRALGAGQPPILSGVAIFVLVGAPAGGPALGRRGWAGLADVPARPGRWFPEPPNPAIHHDRRSRRNPPGPRRGRLPVQRAEDVDQALDRLASDITAGCTTEPADLRGHERRPGAGRTAAARACPSPRGWPISTPPATATPWRAPSSTGACAPPRICAGAPCWCSTTSSTKATPRRHHRLPESEGARRSSRRCWSTRCMSARPTRACAPTSPGSTWPTASLFRRRHGLQGLLAQRPGIYAEGAEGRAAAGGPRRPRPRSQTQAAAPNSTATARRVRRKIKMHVGSGRPARADTPPRPPPVSDVARARGCSGVSLFE